MPVRLVREGILTSERVDAIADDPSAEVFYRRLLSIADDYGRYSAHLSLLRAALYPLRLDKVSTADVSRHMEACSAAGLVRLYEVDGKPYLALVDFKQRTRTKSKYPPPPGYTDVTGRAWEWHDAASRPAGASQLTGACPPDASQTQAYSDSDTEAPAGGAISRQLNKGGGSLAVEQFFEERYARHPKKRDRILAEQALSEIPGIASREVQEKFRRGHEAWIATDEYTWKGGAKCPTLAVFITDRTWQYPPPSEKPAETTYRKWTPPPDPPPDSEPSEEQGKRPDSLQ